MLVAVGVVAAGVAVWAVFLRDTAPAYPADWDPRVADIVTFVEDTRALDFVHPIAIEFLDDAAFEERVQLLEEDSEEYTALSDLLAALGLVPSGTDLYEAQAELLGTSVAGYYDPRTEGIVMPGAELGPADRVTLAHELTHALQDQHYDLNLGDPEQTSGQQAAYRALVEADAVRVQEAYANDVLSEAEFAQYVVDVSAQAVAAQSGDTPEALVASLQFAYTIGPQFADALVADGGGAALDAAFADPPRTEEHILVPRTYLEGEEALDVPPPAIPDGAQATGSGDLGMFSLFLVLGGRLPAEEVRHAVDGWGGDAYQQYEEAGRPCVRFAVLGDDATETSELRDAFVAWAAVHPDASVAEGGDAVEVTACDPGNVGVLPDADGPSAWEVLSLEATVVHQLVTIADMGQDEAQCVHDRLVDEFGVEEFYRLNSDPAAGIEPEVQAAFADAFAACAQ